ncbi:MAG: hypothetical protein QF745_08990, partial [Planctomycetota bacterium]|nr:hypothetical protein [Planctomycetota bacterium]
VGRRQEEGAGEVGPGAKSAEPGAAEIGAGEPESTPGAATADTPDTQRSHEEVATPGGGEDAPTEPETRQNGRKEAQDWPEVA